MGMMADIGKGIVINFVVTVIFICLFVLIVYLGLKYINIEGVMVSWLKNILRAIF